MAISNSRLMRTFNEISDYDFEIKYRPGCENLAADAMSRLITNFNDDTEGYEPHDELPPGFRGFIKKVDGGGDSFFVSLLICLKDMDVDNLPVNVPENEQPLRELLVDALIQNQRNTVLKSIKKS